MALEDSVFDFPPNWSGGVVDRYEYLTDILVARDGSEQRRALRSKPRHSMVYSVALSGEIARNFEYRMWSMQGDSVFMPHWVYRHKTTNEVSPGQTITLSLDRKPSFWIKPGKQLLVKDRNNLIEVCMVQDVSGNDVSLQSPVQKDFEGKVAVFPLLSSSLSNSMGTTRKTSNVLESSITASTFVDGSEPVLYSGSADMMVDGKEALIRKVNWRAAPSIEMIWEKQFVDSSIGVQAFETTGDIASRVRQGTITAKSRDEVEWWLSFYQRQMGRQGEFIAPTWQRDIALQEPSGGTHNFESPGVELARFLMFNPVYKYLFLIKKDGTKVFFPIQAVVADTSGDRTIIETLGWTEEYQPNESIFYCLAANCRLASDTLTIQWLTNSVAEIPLAVTTVRDQQ